MPVSKSGSILVCKGVNFCILVVDSSCVIVNGNVAALINNVKLSSINEEVLSREYLDFWTCDHCGKHTHEVDYDYLGNNRNHLGCELKLEMGEKN